MQTDTVAIIRARLEDATKAQASHLAELIAALGRVGPIGATWLLLPDDPWHRALRPGDYGCRIFLGDARDMNRRIGGFLEQTDCATVVDCSLLTQCLDPAEYEAIIAGHRFGGKPFTTPHMWSPEHLPKIVERGYLARACREHGWPYYNHLPGRDTHLYTPDADKIAASLEALNPMVQAYIRESVLHRERSRKGSTDPYSIDRWLKRAGAVLDQIDDLFGSRSVSVLEIGAGRRFGLGPILHCWGVERYRGIDLLYDAMTPYQFRLLADTLRLRIERRAASLPRTQGPLAPPTLDSADDTQSSFCNGAVQLLQMNAAAMDFPDASFDFIFSDMVLEHIDDIRGAAREMFRVARPGAYLWHEIDFSDHLRGSRSRHGVAHLAMSRDQWRNSPYDTYINLVRPEEHYAIFRECGFDILDVRETKNPAIDADGAHEDHKAYGVSGLYTTSTTVLLRKPA